MSRFYLTNPSETKRQFCAEVGRDIEPGEVIPVTEAVASTLMNAHSPLYVGYDEPDWDYYHAARGERGDPTSIQERPNG